MALVKYPGRGAWVNDEWRRQAAPSLSNTTAIDATGEKLAFVGYFWHPEQIAKDVSRVCFRFGAVTKAGGSGLTISLQNVSLTAGPMQPDETQDQTVAVANGNAAFAANTWLRSDALSANRTLTPGDLVAIVVEYDGSGRLGADSVTLSCYAATDNLASQTVATMIKTASWASVNLVPNVILECSDGSFGTLEGAFPVKTVGTVGLQSDTTPDEVALKVTLPFPIGVDGIAYQLNPLSDTSDHEVNLYDSGGSALKTVSVDAHTLAGAGLVRPAQVPFTEQELTKDATYYYAIKPSSDTQTVTLYYFEVDDANHWKTHPLGTIGTYVERTDAGAWTETTTRRPAIGFHQSSVANDTGGGAVTAISLNTHVHASPWGTAAY